MPIELKPVVPYNEAQVWGVVGERNRMVQDNDAGTFLAYQMPLSVYFAEDLFGQTFFHLGPL